VSSSAACRETFEILSTAVLSRLTDDRTASAAKADSKDQHNGQQYNSNERGGESSAGGKGAVKAEGDEAKDKDGDGEMKDGEKAVGTGKGRTTEEQARKESTGGALSLPKDLQGMDDLFLNPLGAFFYICFLFFSFSSLLPSPHPIELLSKTADRLNP
jgi:glycosyltransferase involved in cell wall biosynthesis